MITITIIKHNQLTSGELLSNDRRAVGFVSSYPRWGGGGGAPGADGGTLGLGGQQRDGGWRQ